MLKLFKNQAKMIKILLSCLILIITLLGCQNAPVVDNGKIVIDSTGEEYNSEDFFLQPICISLETNEMSLISKIDKVIIRDDYIYILDNSSQRIMIYTMSGAYVNSIQRIGLGPGEYIQLMDFNVRDDKLVLYSDLPSKLIYLKCDGEFICENKMVKSYSSFIMSNDRIYFKNSPTDDYTISSLNLEHENPLNYIRSLPMYNSIYMSGMTISKVNDGTILFSRRFDNNIYIIDTNNVISSKTLIFDNNGFIDNNTLKEGIPSHEFFKYCLKNEKVFSIVASQFIQNKLIFNTNLPLLYIYDSVCHTISSLNDNILGLKLYPYNRVFVESDNDYIGFVLNYEHLRVLEKTNPKGKLFDLYQSMNEYSNPVLILYKFK